MQATMQIYLLVITLHILEIVTILPRVCVKNVIRPLRLDNERHMIISELNMLALTSKMRNVYY